MDTKSGTEVIRADDFVEYFLFPSLDDLSGNNTLNKLENFQRDVNECVRKFTVDYIWHKEPFQLVVRTPETAKHFVNGNIIESRRLQLTQLSINRLSLDAMKIIHLKLFFYFFFRF